MHIGYIIAIIAAAIWLGFKIAEIIRAKKQSREVNASTFVHSDDNKE